MQRLYFIHIAKTGGVFLEENLLAATAAEGNPCPAYFWPDLLKLENLAGYNLFLGHLPYFCKDLIGDTFTFTLLRDPVERAMSAFEHIRRDRKHDARIHLEAAPDIASALQHKVLRGHLSNAMMRFLGAWPQYAAFKTREAAIWHAMFETPDELMLQRAKQALAQLDYIGFTDTLNADSVKLFNILGLEIKPEEQLKVRNGNPAKGSGRYTEQLDQESIALLREANALDYKLYAYAQQLAAKRGWR